MTCPEGYSCTFKIISDSTNLADDAVIAVIALGLFALLGFLIWGLSKWK